MFILSYVVTAAASSHLIITLSKHASLRNPFNKPLENFTFNSTIITLVICEKRLDRDRTVFDIGAEKY